MSETPLDQVRTAAGRSREAWRRARTIDAAGFGLIVGLVGASVQAGVLEWTAPNGLTGAALPMLTLWLLPAIGLGLFRYTSPPTQSAAAAELDARLGLSDRVGTALEFAGRDGALVAGQLADAGSHASGANIAAAFEPAWDRLGRRALMGMLLLMVVVGGALTFTWRPAPPPTPLNEAAEDLLASIELERTERVALGDREAVRVLNDLQRRIRRIVARQEEVRRNVAQRRRDAPPPSTEEDDFALPTPPPEREKREPGITVDDLDALEEATLEELALTDAMEAEILSELFHDTQVANRLIQEFHDHDHDEMEATFESDDAAVFSDQSDADRAAENMMSNVDMFNVSQLNPDAMNTPEDRVSSNMDMVRRDLSAESLEAHDRGHDTQESFNRFLKEFVKEMQSTVADKALGRDRNKRKKKKKKGREVKTTAGDAVADKRDQMSQSGFEEMNGPKRTSAEAPNEPIAGNARPGKPPKDGKMQQGKGNGEAQMAMKGKGDGSTSAGAKGAGTGNPNSSDGLRALMPPPGTGKGPLEEVLGTLAQGRMPPEDRDRMFDRMARHKVQAGLTSEADDMMFDYFAEAEELIADHGEYLPPLFRDYAHSYFDAIRPGGPAASGDP